MPNSPEAVGADQIVPAMQWFRAVWAAGADGFVAASPLFPPPVENRAELGCIGIGKSVIVDERPRENILSGAGSGYLDDLAFRQALPQRRHPLQRTPAVGGGDIVEQESEETAAQLGKLQHVPHEV